MTSLSSRNEQSESSLVFNASLGTEVVERVVGTRVDQDLDVAMVCQYVEVPLFAREMPHSHPLSRTVATLSVPFFFFRFLNWEGGAASVEAERTVGNSLINFPPAHKKTTVFHLAQCVPLKKILTGCPGMPTDSGTTGLTNGGQRWPLTVILSPWGFH